MATTKTKQRFIVLWTKPGFQMTFEGDIYAETPRKARERYKSLFPKDTIVAVRLPRNDGSKWYRFV